jgi:hypothetical protein
MGFAVVLKVLPLWKHLKLLMISYCLKGHDLNRAALGLLFALARSLPVGPIQSTQCEVVKA